MPRQFPRKGDPDYQKPANQRSIEIAQNYRKIKLTNDIFDCLLQGLSQKDAAEQLGISEGQVKALVQTAMAQIGPDTLAKIEQWQTLAIYRTEWVLSRVMLGLAAADHDGVVDTKLIKSFIDLVKLQKEIRAPERGDDKNSPNYTQNNYYFEPTMSIGSSLYQSILAEAQREVIDGDFVALPPPPEDLPQLRNAALTRLEEAAGLEPTDISEDERLRQAEERFKHLWGADSGEREAPDPPLGGTALD